MIKKTLTVLLAVVLVLPCLTFLTACGSSVAKLQNLSITGGGRLDPVFNQDILIYNVLIDYYPTTNVEIDAKASPVYGASVAAESITKVTVNKDRLSDSMYIIVRAADGRTTQTYQINVRMDSPDDNANLTSITAGGRTLEPAFNPVIKDYFISVPYQATGTVTVTVTPKAAAATSRVVITTDTGNNNFVHISSKTNETKRTMTITVTAQSGTVKTYTITAEMEARSRNAYLTSLTVANGRLTQAFHREILNYDVELPYSQEGNKTVTATGIPVSGATLDPTSVRTASVSSTERVAYIKLIVVAQDGRTTQTYTITVKMIDDSSSLLIDLSFTPAGGKLEPTVFSPTTYIYAYMVPYKLEESVTVRAHHTMPPTAKLGLGSIESVIVNRNTGPQDIILIVEPQNGSPTTYTIHVSMIVDATDNKLTSLQILGGTLSPVFDPNTVNYTITVPHDPESVVTITAIPSIPVGATFDNPGTSNEYKVTVSTTTLQDTITIGVKAQNGNIRTYTIVVRMASS